ncbi:Hsp70 family protein [Breznakia pachnodae]|uniref:Chaperone protein DnaK n=1 Tax=Breznakia pachnodae TaxID=265178 RepID=A0ABU0E205_9FIRM|nr:Hsp70 family protein [Breznakia pachnodae]MDQ0360851.1 molecular chaperone HscC [Breznakia pachnodae]
MAVIGIDLGTTNSLVVAYRDGKEVMIPNAMNEYLTPSVVSLDDNGDLIVGRMAKERLITHPHHTASLFKRMMGTKAKVKLGNKLFSPEELSAMVVKQLVADAEAYLNEKVEEIVISVPAYFNSKERSATKKVGDLLGIKVERLINEPSAASVACHSSDDFETFIVFDFGGGTLDVSVVDCFDNVVGVCSIAGDNHLGGSDFDKAIALDFCKEHEIDFNSLSISKQESILRLAEKTKIELQEQSEVEMTVIVNEQEYRSIYTNQRLLDSTEPIFIKIKKIIGKAVRESGFSASELDSLILVGGSSYMPIIQNFLNELLNVPVSYTGEVDTLVARGLGKYIGIKQRDDSIKDLVVTDVCPFSLSVNTINKVDLGNDYASVIIPKNTTLPCSEQRPYIVTNLGQEIVNIGIYQGESIYAKENILLGKTEIIIPKNMEAHETFNITFSYDINSILFVEVLIHSNSQQHIFSVGDGEHLESTSATETLKSIKEISLKINKEPEWELLRERVKRIAIEMDVNTSERFKRVIESMEEDMRRHINSIRKKIETIQKYNDLFDQYEKDMDIDNLDIFQKDNDQEGWLS